MTDLPDLVAWPLEHALEKLRQLGRSVQVTEITPVQADERYAELRVVRQTVDGDDTLHLTVAAFIPSGAIQIAHVNLHSAPDDGVYALEVPVARPCTVSVGALGRMKLEPGVHVYVGSARKALPARLRRHAAQNKSNRWHVDYLTALARPTRAMIWPWAEGRECALAKHIGTLGRVVAGFGATDCRCPGHLVRLQNKEADWWRALPEMPPPLRIITTLVSTETDTPAN